MSRYSQLDSRARTICSLLAFAVVAASCVHRDAKLQEKQILSEINRVSEESRQRLTSDETRSSLIHLNELRQSFPDKRNEISKEADFVKAQFNLQIDDSRKIVGMFNQLLDLTVSDTYRQCVAAQVESQELLMVRSQKVIDEMDLLLDRSVSDRQTLDSRVTSIRQSAEEIDQKVDELDLDLERIGCMRPRSVE